MIYKVIPAAMVVQGSTDSVASYFEEIISHHATNGWQFYSMETATAEQSTGCSFSGPTVQRTTTYLLIFCKPSAGESVPTPAYSHATPANTAPVAASVPSASAPAAPRSVVPTTPGWTCLACGTNNKAEYGMCKKCGTYRGSR